MKTSQVSFELDTVTVPCTARDLKQTFGWLLSEMRAVAKILRPDEREFLRKVMNHTGDTLIVGAVFPGFKRDSEAHKTLRRLRAAQFVYPPNTGRWEADESITVTPFARLLWASIGEDRIFSPPPLQPKNPSVDTRTPPPTQQKVVTWDNLLECLRERQKARAAEATNARPGEPTRPG